VKRNHLLALIGLMSTVVLSACGKVTSETAPTQSAHVHGTAFEFDVRVNWWAIISNYVSDPNSGSSSHSVLAQITACNMRGTGWLCPAKGNNRQPNKRCLSPA